MEPIVRISVPDQVQAALLRHIDSCGLKLGDALPGEQELASTLQLSRPCLREALAGLRQMGVIETARRRGMRVARPQPFAALAVLGQGGVDPTTLAEWCELRLVIEVGAAPLLCHRITAADLEFLEHCCSAEEAAPNDPVRLREADRSFHRHLFIVLGNQQLDQLQERLLAFFDTRIYHDTLAVRLGDCPSARLGHRCLLERLIARDVAGYAQCIQEHLTVYLPATCPATAAASPPDQPPMKPAAPTVGRHRTADAAPASRRAQATSARRQPTRSRK